MDDLISWFLSFNISEFNDISSFVMFPFSVFSVIDLIRNRSLAKKYEKEIERLEELHNEIHKANKKEIRNLKKDKHKLCNTVERLEKKNQDLQNEIETLKKNIIEKIKDYSKIDKK